MAHELAFKRNGQAAMAFVGETPWHKLGQKLTEGASIETWQVEAGMNWTAAAAPLSFTRADGTTGSMDEKRVIYRTDTGAPLSVMGDAYKIVQPGECLEFFRDLIAAQGFQLHTAGVLLGGRKLWALARTGERGEVVKGDRVAQFLMMATSLDGTTPTTVDFTDVRVVCANTLRIATSRLSDKAVKVSHRSTFDAAAVKAQLGLSSQAWQFFMDATRKMAAQSCDMEQARAVLRQVFGNPVPIKGKPAATSGAAFLASIGATTAAQALALPMIATKGEREQKSVARCLELFAGAGRGATHAGVLGTRWGLLNAVTEHIDHEQGRTPDNRLNSAWFGRGDDFKQHAFDLLTA